MGGGDCPSLAHKGVEKIGAVRVKLQRLRDSVDNLDAALVHLLSERFKCTQEIGKLKATNNLTPGDPAREAVQIARLHRLAEEARLDPTFAEKFLRFIIDEVIRRHVVIARQSKRREQVHSASDVSAPQARPSHRR